MVAYDREKKEIPYVNSEMSLLIAEVATILKNYWHNYSSYRIVKLPKDHPHHPTHTRTLLWNSLLFTTITRTSHWKKQAVFSAVLPLSPAPVTFLHPGTVGRDQEKEEVGEISFVFGNFTTDHCTTFNSLNHAGQKCAPTLAGRKHEGPAILLFSRQREERNRISQT